jgi:putative intracellular protease/amidase
MGLASSEDSNKLISSFYSNNKPVAFVCHSSSDEKRKSKRRILVKGKKVTGFST